MKKSINYWNKFTVYGFVFDGPIDLCEYVRTARINTNIFTIAKIKEYGSEGNDSTVNGGGWYRTKNLEEALKMCEDGWNEGYDFYKSLNKRLERRTDKLQAISADRSKPINILVDLAYSVGTPVNAIINRGVMIQNLVRVLEKNGYKVNLKAFSLISLEKELSCIVTKLKETNKELDPRRAYFAFCNPSFLRRIIFRVMECSEFKNPNWIHGYGYTCLASFIKEAFNADKLDIVIPQASEIGIQGDNIEKDWKQFLQYENLEDFFQA